MLQKFQFTISDVDLGTTGSEDSTFIGGAFGNKNVWEHRRLSTSPEDGAALSLTYQTREYLKLGFEVDFFATLGDVDVVAPFFVDLDFDPLIREGATFEIDSTEWSWADTFVLASGPKYSLGLDFVTEILFATRDEKLEVFGSDLLNPFVDINLPDYYAIGDAIDGFKAGAYRNELFSLNSEETYSTEFEIGLADFEVSLPRSFGALTDNNINDNDYLADGVTIADSTSDPFFVGAFSLDDLLKATNVASLNALAAAMKGEFALPDALNTALNTVRGEPFSDKSWTFGHTFLDFVAEFGLTFATEYVFTPGDIQMRIENLTTESVVFAALGDVVSFADMSAVGENDFEVTYTLSGNIAARYGIGTSLVFPFTVLDFDLTSDEGDEISLSDGLSEQLPYQPFEGAPIYLYETDGVDVTFDGIVDRFTVTVLDSDNHVQDPEDPVLPEELSLPSVVSLQTAEAEEGGALRFDVRLSEPALPGTVLYYSVNALTAEPGDFAPTFDEISVPQGDLAATIEIATEVDDDYADEALNLIVYAADNAVLTEQISATGLILDPDNPPPLDDAPEPDPDEPPVLRPVLVSVGNDSVDAGETLTFALDFDRAATTDVGIVYQILRGTAEPEDFIAAGARTLLASGSDRAIITVPTHLDEDSADEEIKLRILALEGADFANDSEGLGTIRDVFVPAPVPSSLVSFEDAAGIEGGLIAFNVQLDRPATEDVRISFGIEFLTAENADYAPTGDLEMTIAQGEMEGVIEIDTNTDLDSRNETFRLFITDTTNLEGVSDSSAIGTIIDPDQALLPEIVATEITVTEGNSQSIPVKLAYNPQNKTVTADYVLTSGTATAGSDFVPKSGTISLSSDDSFKFITLNTIEDSTVETNETLSLEFSNIIGGAPVVDPFVMTIQDNDGANGSFGFYFDTVGNNFTEGSQVKFDLVGIQYAGGPSAIGASLDLRYDLNADVTSVTSHFIDSGGNIRSNTYQGNSGILPIDPFYFNRSNTTQYYFVTADLADDTEFTGDRTGGMTARPGLTNGQPIIVDPVFMQRQAEFNIIENDAPPPPRVTVSSAVVEEGEFASVVVSLEYARAEAIGLRYEIQSAALPAEAQFATTEGQVVIPAGALSAEVSLETFEDAAIEAARGFDFRIVEVTQGEADISAAVAMLTVLDDDLPIFTEGNDNVAIIGIEPDNDFEALGGNDTVTGSSRRDIIDGGPGDDVLAGKDGNDVLITGSGEDIITGQLEELDGDRIQDFDAMDKLVIESEQIGAGNLSLRSGSAIIELDVDQDGSVDGRFTLAGNFDDAVFEITYAGDNTEITLAGPSAVKLSSAGERFITGDPGDNRIFGDGGDDLVLAGDGDDLVDGGSGSDVLFGGNGNDTLSGGRGNDELRGGRGADDFVISASDFDGFGVDTITDFAPGEDRVVLSGFAETSFTVFSDGLAINTGTGGFVLLEGITEGDLGVADVVTGPSIGFALAAIEELHDLTSDSDRFVTTDNGPNVVRAGGGDDSIVTADGADLLLGEDGSDLLLAGAGADTLVGGAGNDILSGGTGADRFEFEAGVAGFVVDTIVDFEFGIDVVALSGYDTPSLLELGGSGAAKLSATEFVVFEGSTLLELQATQSVFEFV